MPQAILSRPCGAVRGFPNSFKIRLFSSPCTLFACTSREEAAKVQNETYRLSSFYFRLTRLRQLKILDLDLLKTSAYQEPSEMANQPQPTSRRVLMLVVFAISFIAAYFLVRYLIR
jgi:hypothetical protein